MILFYSGYLLTKLCFECSRGKNDEGELLIYLATIIRQTEKHFSASHISKDSKIAAFEAMEKYSQLMDVCGDCKGCRAIFQLLVKDLVILGNEAFLWKCNESQEGGDMSFMKAAKFCRLCYKEEGEKKELMGTVMDALVNSAEAYQEYTQLRIQAEAACYKCNGEKPIVAEMVEKDYIFPMEEATRRHERSLKRAGSTRIKRQERREMHKNVAPGKVIEYDLAVSKIKRERSVR